jgi:ATP-dependent Clp protease protease subunit
VNARSAASGNAASGNAASGNAVTAASAASVSAARLRRDPFPRRPDPWQVPQEQPGGSDASARMSAWLEERLFDQRIIVLRGWLDGALASQTVGALLALDALGPDPIQMHMSAPDGDLAAAFAIVDTIDALQAPVHAVVTSQVGGAAVLVFAAAGRRVSFTHALVRLAEPHVANVAGTADQVTAAAGQYLRELEEMAVRLASVTGQPRSRVEDDLNAGRTLTAEQGREYGLIDDILGPAGPDGQAPSPP